MLPLRRMKGRAGKAVQPIDVRQQRAVELAGGGDQVVGGQRLATGGGDLPAAAIGIKACIADFAVQPNAMAQVVFVCAVTDVGVDFVLACVLVRPVGTRFKRVGVQV